jgi:hypothetical protein
MDPGDSHSLSQLESSGPGPHPFHPSDDLMSQDDWKFWRKPSFNLIDLRMTDPAHRHFYQNLPGPGDRNGHVHHLKRFLLDGCNPFENHRFHQRTSLTDFELRISECGSNVPHKETEPRPAHPCTDTNLSDFYQRVNKEQKVKDIRQGLHEKTDRKGIHKKRAEVTPSPAGQTIVISYCRS